MAELAGMNWDLICANEAIKIKFNGYDSSIKNLINEILPLIVNLNLNKNLDQLFNHAKEKLN